MDNTVVVSTPPHVKSKRTTRGIMLDVIIALIPCAVCGIVYFGWRAFVLELVAVLACVATEFVYFFIANKGFAKKCKDAGKVCVRWLKQFDLTSVVTGLILALIVPAKVNWYEILIGSIFAIAVVKMLFGGTGKNLVNPAAAARVFIFLSFAATMTNYVAPNFGTVSSDSGTLLTGATNLNGILCHGEAYTQPSSILNSLDLFLGTGVAGCIGETCKVAILIGYIYLAARRVIKWWQPLMFIAIFGFVAVFMSGFRFDSYKFDMTLYLPHILSGGVMFAAVFMFPDYVTSPKCVWGQILHLGLSAILLAVLRHFTQIEVASFVILIMNLFVPLIDKYVRPRPFGYVKVKKEKKSKSDEKKLKEVAENLIVDTNAAAKPDKEGK